MIEYWNFYENPKWKQKKILSSSSLKLNEMSQKKQLAIHFHIHYVTVPGQQLRVVGSLEQIGSWDPYKDLLWHGWSLKINIAQLIPRQF